MWTSEAEEDLEQENQNKYYYLANKEEFSAEQFDFDDPAALLKRQKAILAAISKHKDSQESFDPFRLLRKGKTLMWILILCHGGKFLINVY